MHGDQLYREVFDLPLIQHHAFELPDGLVAELGPFCGTRVVAFDDFAKGRSVGVVPRNMTMAERDAAVKRALSRVGDKAYSVFGWNCEHFATWCATGVAVSKQAVQWLERLKNITVGLILGLLFMSLRTA
jgi:hypothetical protein